MARNRDGSKKASPKKKKLPFSLRIRCREQVEPGSVASTSAGGSNDAETGNWRTKMKKGDPKKYQMVKDSEKTYARLYRLNMALAEGKLKKRNLTAKEKEEAEKWVEKRKRYNEGCKKRQRKYVKKRKDAQKDQPKKPMTRQETDKKKEYERNKKRQQRAGWSKERKEAELEKRRGKYAQNREKEVNERLRKMKEKEDRLQAIEAKLEQKELELENQKEELAARNKELQALDMRSQQAKRKSLSRAKAALPRQPVQFAATVGDLIERSSPRKTTAMKKAGVTRKKGRSKITLEEAVTMELEEQMQPNKPKRKVLAATLSSMKKYKLQREACRRFKINRKLLQSKRKRRGKMALRLDVIREVKSFYESNSIQLPYKKLVSKKTGKPRHIMETSIAALHEKYQKAHPDKKVSPSQFYVLRPRHVRPMAEAKYNGCLCEYCENINLKISALQRFHPHRINMYSLVNSTMCPKQDGSQFHQPKCIQRQCSDCGISALDELINNDNKDVPVQWKRWEVTKVKIHTNKGKRTIKRRNLEGKSGTLQKLVNEIKTEVAPHAQHLFNKEWQQTQYKELREKLRGNEVLSVWDFSENYKCNFQREVQSAYYSQESATLHPVITYYRCTTCEKTVQESLIFISNDLHHDHHLVNMFQKKVAQHLTQTRKLPLQTLHRYSDGCACQYKSKGPFSDVSYSTEDFAFKIQHHFYGTRHGKGASDGEGAVIKSKASKAVMAGTVVISNAEGLYSFTKDNLTKSPPEGQCCQPFRRTAFYIPASEVDRERVRIMRTVKGTRRIHAVKNIEGGVIGARNLSCFCDHCLKGEGARCKNAAYVMKWRRINLASGGSKTGKFLSNLISLAYQVLRLHLEYVLLFYTFRSPYTL